MSAMSMWSVDDAFRSAFACALPRCFWDIFMFSSNRNIAKIENIVEPKLR